MKQKVYLGIDTSCYTTSVAVLDEAGKLVGEARKILDVKPGRCGLQQSEMVFQHTRNLPNLMEEDEDRCSAVYELQDLLERGYLLVGIRKLQLAKLCGIKLTDLFLDSRHAVKRGIVEHHYLAVL